MPAIFPPPGSTLRRMISLRFIVYSFFLLTSMNVIGQQEEKSPAAFLRLNEVNSRASRHFLSHYSRAASVKWTRDENYYIACFEADHSRSRVYYRINGNFAFSLKNYLADGLNPDLKSAILKKFPGCQIMMVTELALQEKQAFIIKVKYGQYLKTLRCNDEGIEVTENIIDAGI